MNYKINFPRIALETIDDETIIIDFETGLYFTAKDEASLILMLIYENYNKEQIIDYIESNYTCNNTIYYLIDNFINLIESHNIIIKTDKNSIAEIKNVSNLNSKPIIKTFNTPTLQIFSDMKDMLLLDPIHDVKNEGWPNKK